jgi:SAM-dependent methyltransferase
VAVPSWFLDEAKYAGAEHLDDDYVAADEVKSATDWSDQVAELQRLGIGADSTVVDLGAGTGTFAEAIRPHVKRVVAVDVSPAMVRELHARGFDAVQAGFLTYEHSGEPADAVVTRNALHHLPDFFKALALERIATMLRPGGVFALQDLIFSFEPKNAPAALNRWLEAATTDPAHGWTADQLAEHMRTEFSTYTWLLEPMLDHAGFDIRERELSASEIYTRYVCLRRRA